jgi:hypothetical protein
VTTAERATPERDPRGFDALQLTGVSERRGPILELAFDVEELARLALASAEVTVVKRENGKSAGLKALCIPVEAHLLDRAQTVTHHHQRGPV